MTKQDEQISQKKGKAPERAPLTKEEIQLQVNKKKEIEEAQGVFTGILASYLQKKAKIIEYKRKLEKVEMEVKRMEDDFDYLKKLNKKIHEVGRNVAGIGEGVKKVDNENKERKRKRESLQEEAKKVRKIMEIAQEGDNESV